MMGIEVFIFINLMNNTMNKSPLVSVIIPSFNESKDIRDVIEHALNNSYKNIEIISKMFSLKGVLEPFSSNENRNFLKRAGFKDISTISKDLCFEGILAIK